MVVFRSKLCGERIVLRRSIATTELAKQIFAQIDKSREHLSWMDWVYTTHSWEDTFAYLESMQVPQEEGKKIDYNIFVGDKYAGNIGVFDVDDNVKSAEIGYWLSADFVKKGYMSEAVELIKKELFGYHEFNRLQIKCDAQNKASAAVAKSCGFTLEGVLRQDSISPITREYRDTYVFSRLASDE